MDKALEIPEGKRFLELGPENNKHSRRSRFNDNWYTVGRSQKTPLDLTWDLDTPIPFEDNSFEIVFSSHVLEHLVDPVFTLRECFRVLKPGGICRANVPDARYYINRYLKGRRNIEKTLNALRSYEPGMHRHGIDAEKIVRDFRSAGFIDCEVLMAPKSKTKIMTHRYFSTRRDRTIYCEGVKPCPI